MPSNLEICLEELDARPEDECYIRCVAVDGGQPGLALDRDGLVQWMPEETDGCHGLWVSQDGRLMLYGSKAPRAVVVERGERFQEAPAGKPVVLIDQDLLRVGDRRLRVHIHGETEELYEPERLTRSAMLRFFQAAAAAASLTLGGAALASGAAPGQAMGGEPAPIEVRLRPPAPPVRRAVLDCTITAQSTKAGKLTVKATCARTSGLYVGAFGTLVDKKTGRNISNGSVKVTSIQGKVIRMVCNGRKKPVKAAGKVRFWVRP